MRRPLALLGLIAASVLPAEAAANCICLSNADEPGWTCTTTTRRRLCPDLGQHLACGDGAYCEVLSDGMSNCVDLPLGVSQQVPCYGTCETPTGPSSDDWACFERPVAELCSHPLACEELFANGVPIDAGPPDRDAGPGGQPDAGGSGLDAGDVGAFDAGPAGTPDEPRFSGGAGCGCRASARPDGGPLGVLALLAVGLLRRRR